MSVQDLQAFDKYFPDQGFVRYHPGFADIFGSISAAILLCRLLYWHGKGKNKRWTYKTIADMRCETGLSRSKQESAIKILKDAGILTVVLKRTPATRHFRINLIQLHKVTSSLQESSKLDSTKVANNFADIPLTITKTTAETTAQSTKNKTLGSVEPDMDDPFAWVKRHA